MTTGKSRKLPFNMTDDIKATSMELALELAEVPLDQLLAEGLLRDIPVLGTAYRMARLALSIRDQIFLAKVVRFLIPVKRIPDEEREAFTRRLAEDRGTARKAGEAILLIIDKLDDMEKPEMVGKIFCAYIRGSISLEHFRRICAAIGAANISDLGKFASQEDESLLRDLVGTGLAAMSTAALNEVGHHVFSRFEKTALGDLFQRLMRDQK